MTGGVQENAKRRAWLVFGPGRTEFEHCQFSGIEVVNHDVDVHLLRDVLARPLRRPELCDALEADALVTCCVSHLAPTFVRACLPIEQLSVERGEAGRVVAIKDKRRKSCNCHTLHRMPGCGQILTGIRRDTFATHAQHSRRNGTAAPLDNEHRTLPRFDGWLCLWGGLGASICAEPPSISAPIAGLDGLVEIITLA